MTSPISTERVFSLSCFEGLRLLRKYGERHPHLAIDDLMLLIERVESDARSLDMDASVHLSSLVEMGCPLDGPAFYQVCIRAVIFKLKPIWSKAMRSGRRRFIKTLADNDQDVFAAAGLMHEPPPRHVVTWWDDVSGFARLISDQQKMDQGREAEMLTIEYERNRLKSLGIDKDPMWPGLDDNFAGYDVLSYDGGVEGLVNLLIEVKSTVASPLRFILTRNEWDKAEKVGENYIFHIWDMALDRPVLHIRGVGDVAPHIPSDNSKGRWSAVAIPVGPSSA